MGKHGRRIRSGNLVSALMLVVVASVLQPSSASAQEKLRMRIQAAVPSGAMSFEMLQRFGKRLEVMSDGRLQVQVLGAGAIVPSPRILDSVDRGVLEAGFAWPQYWAGKHAATALFSNTPVWPMAGLDQMTHFAWMYEQGGDELYHELLQKVIGVNVVSVFVTPSGWQPLGWFKAPIKDMAQFRRLKYRSPPGLAGEIFKEAGVTAVFMPGEEIIPAAERGVIDGAEWINPVEDLPFGFQQVFKHYHLASIHQFIDVGEIVISGKFWSRLTPAMQEMVRTAAKATMIDTFTADIARNAAVLKKLRAEGITVSATPPDVHAALMQAAQKVLERHAQKDPFYKKVVDSQIEFARAVQPWWGEVLRIYQDLSNDAVIR
ncbi:MAG TPA: TRAP transporter substrate-binding protein [Aestuariivirgaceae bacterium]|nr:TRAP transporter substrate-binding protein [Aestuariivirgaceae bacterium]